MVKATQNRNFYFPGMYINKPQTPNKIGMVIDSVANQKILDGLGVKHIHSSISHEEEYSIAFVVLES